MNMKKRDSLLDLMKGVGILLVMFAHIYKGQLTYFIYLFHMPLFFIITGCTLAYSKNRGG
jgi:fucose 4-O-acetylase-like acetyltransferase